MPFMDFHANDDKRGLFPFVIHWMGNWPGWGNGYVYIPKGHPYYEKDRNEIPYEVHGGVNFAEPDGDWWVIGWDTCHSYDTLETWPEERVRAENAKLLAQVVADMILMTITPDDEGGIS